MSKVMEPDPWQVSFLRSTDDYLLLCSRQSGKSTTCGALASHTADYKPESLTLLLSRSLRQSSELFRKVAKFHYLVGQVKAKNISALQMELVNGSRVVSLPGRDEDTIVGYSAVDLLLIDEASRVSDSLYYTVRPMMAVSQGRIVALSTPRGKRGWFYEEWINGEGWQRREITADQCPRIPRKFLEKEKKRNLWYYKQEYMCEFLEPEDSWFNYADVHGSLSSDVKPLFPEDEWTEDENVLSWT